MCWNFGRADGDSIDHQESELVRAYFDKRRSEDRPMQWQMVIYMDVVPGYYCEHQMWHIDENYRKNHPDIVSKFPDIQKHECCGCCKRPDFPGKLIESPKPRDTFEF